MKKILTLSLALLCFSFSALTHAPAKATPAKAAPAVKRLTPPPASWPRDVPFQIFYHSGMPGISLVWPIQAPPSWNTYVTFMGVSQLIDPTAYTSVYWMGIAYTLTSGVTYGINISGVTYYFQVPSAISGGWCTITGHT